MIMAKHNIRDRVIPGGDFSLKVLFEPYDDGERCLIIAFYQGERRETLRNVSMEEAKMYSAGFYRAMQIIVDIAEEDEMKSAS